jgi:hypothetical protein
LSQPRSKAGQSSVLRSSAHPGSSPQPTRIQRECARTQPLSRIAAAASGAAGPRDGTGAGGGIGAEEHDASSINMVPASSVAVTGRTLRMWVILLEAFGAAAVLVLIVWFTMFQGRPRGERRDPP